jgi:hypothetical protein
MPVPLFRHKHEKNRLRHHTVWMSVFAFLVFSCDYGMLGGADKTETLLPQSPLFEQYLSSLEGVWYSHYAGVGRLDGYRIGKAADFDGWGKERARMLFPAAGDFSRIDAIDTCTGATIRNEEYLLLYDDTAYGQQDDSAPAHESWGFAYLGVVRALNIFNGNPKRGAIIIEYVADCTPKWLDRWPASRNEQVPFFGMYYRTLSANTVQMANAVNLAALYAGMPYYTEKTTLNEAINSNKVETEAEYISWGVVIPQNKE